MKFVLLVIAAASAIKLQGDPAYDYTDYTKDMYAKADGMHAGTMGQADKLLSNQQAGVAGSAAEQHAYNVAHGCSF